MSGFVYLGTVILNSWDIPSYQPNVMHYVYEDQIRIQMNAGNSLNIFIQLRSRFESTSKEFPVANIITTESTFLLHSFDDPQNKEKEIHDLFNFSYWKHFEFLENYLKNSKYIHIINPSRDTIRFTQSIRSEMNKVGLQ